MFASVRSRVTAIALLSTLLILAATAVALLLTIERSLLSEIDATITNRASDVADGIVLNDEINNATFPTDGETFIGVLEPDLDGEAILWVHNDLEPDAEEFLAAFERPRPFERFGNPTDGSFASLSLTEGADNMRVVFGAVPTGAEVVIVARSLESLDRTVARVRTVALIAVPLLSLGIGFLVWLLVGRALHPVDAMRREVESIRATDLRRRVRIDGQPTEVADLATTMNSMLGRLEVDQRRQQQFASDAAHELRSPLASIAAQLDVDAAYPDTADLATTARRVRAETQRLQDLVEDLMVLARAEGTDVAHFRSIDLDDVARVAIGAVDPGAVVVHPPTLTGEVVRGDERQLERVITNLVHNGVRHARSAVQVALHSSPGWVVITVDDDGEGVPAHERERIFERFVRLDDARSRDRGGTGLGLAMAREIAEQHGGRLAVSTSSLGGARFEFALPTAAR